MISTQLNAQDCELATSQVELNANDVKANFFPSGSWWWDGSDGKYIYPSVPEGSGLPEVSAIFAGGLWISGVDEAGNLKLAASTYGQSNGRTDYYPGPLNENGATDETTCTNYDKFFGANGQEINTHITDFQDNGLIDGVVPNSILGWPGVGNPNFFSVHGFELPNNTSPLAPFVDQNNNGIYEPTQGDYPDIKLADQAFWWVFNDNGGPHTESQGEPLGFEIQMLAYAYNSAEPAINDATYYDIKMINKSGENLTDVHASIWFHPELGCFADDFVGCVPNENIAYVYNEDDVDGTVGCECADYETYCEEIPIVGIKLLKGMTSYENGNAEDLGMTSFMIYRGGALCDPPGALLGPNDPIEYQYFQKGLWRDGWPLSYGGSGYDADATSEDFTSYVYPDPPADPDGWSMCTAWPSWCFKKALMTSGPVTAPIGAIQQLSFAVIAQPNVPHPCPDISGLIEIGNTVQEVFEDPTSTSNIIYNNNLLTIQPNPFSEQTTIAFKESSEQIQSLNLYAIDGKLVRNYLNINTNSLTINRADLRSGMYLYSIIATNGQVMTGKIVVE